MKAEIELISGRMVSAFFDGGYQGLLIIVAIWGALKLSRNANAATRYAAWLTTLFIVAALPLVHFFLPRVTEAAPFEVEPPIHARAEPAAAR